MIKIVLIIAMLYTQNVYSESFMELESKYDRAILIAAASSCDLSTIKYLMRKNKYLSVDEKDKDYRTLLILASGSYHSPTECFEVVKYLIEKDASVNAKDLGSKTALFYAIENENLDLVKYLIDHKADPNIHDDGGFFPIHKAIINLKRSKDDYEAYRNNVLILKYLVEKGAELNVTDKYKETPLYYTIDLDYNVAKYLVEKGAEVNFDKKNDRYSRLLLYIINTIICADRPDSTSTCGEAVDNTELFKYLVSAGIDINVFTSEFSTPLISFIYERNFEMVKYLVENGANVNWPYSLPIIWAVKTCNLDIVRYLVEKDASVFPATDDMRFEEALEAANIDYKDNILSVITSKHPKCLEASRYLSYEFPRLWLKTLF